MTLRTALLSIGFATMASVSVVAIWALAEQQWVQMQLSDQNVRLLQDQAVYQDSIRVLKRDNHLLRVQIDKMGVSND